MALMKAIQKTIDTRGNKLLVALQGLTALGVLLSILLMLHVGPYTLFIFMTVAQGLILVSLVIALIILTLHKKNIMREHFGPGEVIIRKGDAGDKLYVVVRGEVEVVDEAPDKGERVVATLGAGKCFGEMALVRDEPRSATVRSRTGVSLVSLDREGFQALFTNLDPLRRMFEEMVEERLTSGKQTNL